MSESLTTRKPRKRRRIQPERPMLQLPVADSIDPRSDVVETKPEDRAEAPERGVAVVDFYI